MGPPVTRRTSHPIVTPLVRLNQLRYFPPSKRRRRGACLSAGLQKSARWRPGGGLAGQSLIDYLGKNLRVTYVRSPGGSGGTADIVLTNAGRKDIPPGARMTTWTVYFNHATAGERSVNVVGRAGRLSTQLA